MNYPDDITYWLLANSLWWIPWPVWQSALNYFGTWQNVFHASTKELHAIGFTTRQVEALVQRKSRWSDTNVWRWLQEKPHRYIVPLCDAQYPPQLKEIYDPPLVLYVEGELQLLSKKQIAVVGARHASQEGRKNAAKMSHDLVKQDLIVTSGLALGIDQEAHSGALAAGGYTIGVAGTGLLHYYPQVHRNLIQQIANGKQGAVISEFDLTSGANKVHFPRRNRIIAALSLGVLVIEAACRSGSLITARLANEYGRDVFAVPGSPHHELSRGCHALIKQGARLVESVEDIVSQLQLPLVKKPAQVPLLPLPTDWSAEEKQLYELLSKSVSVSLEWLVMKSGLTVTQVSSILMDLELSGWVYVTSGGFIKQ